MAESSPSHFRRGAILALTVAVIIAVLVVVLHHLNLNSARADLDRQIRDEASKISRSLDNDARIASGLEQQGDVQYDGAIASAPAARNEGTLLLLDHGVENALEPCESGRLSKHRLTQRHAVHGSVAHRAGKCRLDRPDRPPTARL